MGNKSDKIVLGHDNKNRPVAPSCFQRCVGRDITATFHCHGTMTGSFDTEPVIDSGRDIVADFAYLSGHRFFGLIAVSLHDSPHLWIGDDPAITVNDHGTSGLANL